MRRRTFLAVASVTALAGCSRLGSDGESEPSPEEDPIDEAYDAYDGDPELDVEDVSGLGALVETADRYDSLSFDDGWQEQFTAYEDGYERRIEDDLPDVSLRVTWAADDLYGVAMDLFMQEQYGFEPEAAHLRTWLRFPEEWEFHEDGLGGTKLPGFASRFNRRGEADQGGWGGREADGTNGWSARLFNCRPDRHPEGAGPISLGTQIYHADAANEHGDHPRWSDPLETGTWHQLDQFVEVNEAGEPDGTFLGWVDGELSIAVDDLYMRDPGYEDIAVESLWFMCYFGGDWGSPVDQHVDFDDLQLWLWLERPDITL